MDEVIETPQPDPPPGPDARLGTYIVVIQGQVLTFDNCYPEVACETHTNTLKICRSGSVNKWGEREEIVLAMFRDWTVVERVVNKEDK